MMSQHADRILYLNLSNLLDPRFKHHFFRSQEAFQAAKKQVFLELDSSILSRNETTPVMKTTSIKNTGFSSMMQNIIAQSQNTRSKNPTSKLAKEVLNECLESPTSSCCLEFWKEYEEKTTLKAKLVLAKVAKRFLTPQPTLPKLKGCFQLLEKFFQMKGTDICQKKWKKFYSVEKIFQLLTLIIKMS